MMPVRIGFIYILEIKNIKKILVFLYFFFYFNFYLSLRETLFFLKRVRLKNLTPPLIQKVKFFNFFFVIYGLN